MVDYVVGFAFSEDRTELVLIKKTKPAWQAGMLNGVGGKIEEYDLTPTHAMHREFLEETGVDSPFLDWKEFAILTGEGYRVHCFYIFTDLVYDVKTTTEESVICHGVEWGVPPYVKGSDYSVLPNIPFLLGLISTH